MDPPGIIPPRLYPPITSLGGLVGSHLCLFAAASKNIRKKFFCSLVALTTLPDSYSDLVLNFPSS